MDLLSWPFIVAGVVAFIALKAVIFAVCFRVVVPTNDVHIVQSAKKSTSYGKDQEAGNSYYKYPSWIPVVGVRTIELPVSNFSVLLTDYEAYDKGRLPFRVDVMAFFRIANPVLAAQRISDFKQLKDQLVGILQGACRTILATSEIETILEGRAEFGERFTKEVDHNLANWGVSTVKNIEFMDVRDTKESKVILNIMDKKKSFIEMESRVAVANNNREARLAEISAAQIVEVKKQEAEQSVGIRSAEKDKEIGIANERSKQEVKAQEALTTQKNMDIKQIESIRSAEINRDVQVVAADQLKQTEIIKADAEKQKTIIVAEGQLEKSRLISQGIEAEGKAKGTAEEAVLMAPVNAQISLAKEIGSNHSYQDYLTNIEIIKKDKAVGIAQAEALKAADIKVIANSGDVSSGIKSATELFSSKGGTQIGAMIEAIAQTPAGEAIVKTVTNGGSQNGKSQNNKQQNGKTNQA